MKRGFILLVVLLLSVSMLPAQEIKGNTGIFNIAYPFTLAKGVAAFTLGVNNIDLDTNNIDVNKFYFGATYAVIDGLELNFNLSYNRVHATGTPPQINSEYPFADRWQENLGYAALSVKYNFLKNSDTGFGILGHLGLPLSDEEAGVSTGKAFYGADLLFAHSFSSKLIFSANVGYQIFQDPDNLDISNIFRYAAGVEIAATKGMSFIMQLAGKSYSDSDVSAQQSSPLDGILGVKFENDNFGISIGYKKNLAFEGNNLGDTHGGIGSIWLKTSPPPPPEPDCIAISSISIKGASSAISGGSYSYQAAVEPSNSSTPISYNWECSDNGKIKSGQNSPTIDIVWDTSGPDSWIKIAATNKCSSQSKKISVIVDKQILPPKEEYYFGFDSSDITDCLKKDLDTAVEYFKHHPDKKVLLLGFTCSIATEEYNLALGEQRANSIKEYLSNNGISTDRIKTVSYGEAIKVNLDNYGIIEAYDNSAEKSRKKNRRVFIPQKK